MMSFQNDINLYKESWPAEFRLMLDMLAGRDDTTHREKFNPDSISNEKFLNLLTHHRTFSLVHLAQNKTAINIPAQISEKIRQRTAEIQTKSLHQLNEMIRLSLFFRKNNIKVLFFKGPLLSRQLYDDPGYRESKDIDILIDFADIHHTDNLLHEAGYKGLFRHEKLKNPLLKKLFKDTGYHHREKDILIEVHWNLLGIKKFFSKSFVQVYENRQHIEIGNHSIDTLGLNDLFHYLCVHGTAHKWFRLFWLTDIFQFTRKYPLTVEGCSEEMKKYGNSASYTTALELCRILFTMNCTSQISKTDSKQEKLAAICLHEIISPEKHISRNIFKRIGRLFYFMKLNSGISFLTFLKYIYLFPAYIVCGLFLRFTAPRNHTPA
ncbi:MAG: nucleotidyltransferase family protein, partial [Bacteroidota bacterium]